MQSAIYRFTTHASSKHALYKCILAALERVDFEIYNRDDLYFFISRFFRDIIPDFSSPFLFELSSDRLATVCIERIPSGFEFSIRVEY